MSRYVRTLMVLVCMAVLFGCTEEDPTDIGGPLLPPGDVVTFEVILEPAQFLAFDTAFSGYADASEVVPRLVQVMRNFEGVVSANALYRYGTLPTTLQVRDSAGTLRTDSVVRFPSGYLLLRVDTLASRGSGTFGVYRTAQDWEASSANWTLRIDTGGVQLPWSQPGGARAAQIGASNWSAGTDSLTVPLDSAMIVALTDTATSARGTLLTFDQAGAGGASVRVTAATLRLNGKSRIRPDTTVVTSLDPIGSTFVFNPAPASVSGQITVSGVPAWRGMLRLLELRDLMIPCPGTGCTLRLRDAFINQAELLLAPTGSALGFSPDDSIVVNATMLLETPNVPLERSPIAPLPNQSAGASAAVARTRFTTTDAGAPVAVPVTGYVDALIADTATTASGRVPRQLALLTIPEALTFGYANFRPGPRLRLVLTISTEQSP
ncbi:MAG: hypothetical protein ACRENP_00510 [Longimicrobiales bacterium]